MRYTVFGLVAAFAVSAVQPATASAQYRAGVYAGWGVEVGVDRAPRPRRPVGVKRYEAAPSFCRTGRGHPVYGWRWCVEKGYASYSHVRRYPSEWRSVRWGNIYFYDSPASGRGWYARGTRHTLWDIVGDRVYDRLERHRSRLGVRGVLTGVWVDRGVDALALQIRAGPIPIAELIDFNLDGRIDRVLLRRSFR
jgi:hypothetical protein